MEKNDEGDDTGNMEETSNLEREDAVEHLYDDDGSAAVDNEQQTTSARHMQSQAAHDSLQEKIKDFINVAHVSHYFLVMKRGYFSVLIVVRVVLKMCCAPNSVHSKIMHETFWQHRNYRNVAFHTYE